jgi:HK97 gp10 family phage protein
MASFGVNGLDGLMLSLSEAAELPDDVAEEMLTEEAEIVEEAQVYQGMAMGVYDTGETLRSISHGKMKRTNDGGRAMYVYPQGTDENGIRNAEVAFINEFGKHGQTARPFIRTANEEAADPAVEAAAKVYDKFLKSKNL